MPSQSIIQSPPSEKQPPCHLFGSSWLALTFSQVYEFRRNILGMLRPLDIISVTSVIDICLTTRERGRYLIWWKQFFFNMNWVKALSDKGCTIDVIGNDLRRLNEALIHHDTTLAMYQLRLVVVVGESQALQSSRSYEHHHHLLTSFDVTVAWHEVPYPMSFSAYHRISLQPATAQICFVSIMHNTVADLGHSWARTLSNHQGPLSKFYLGPDYRYKTSHQVWETIWQQLTGNPQSYVFKPVQRNYIVKRAALCRYTMRLFVDKGGVCFTIDAR